MSFLLAYHKRLSLRARELSAGARNNAYTVSRAPGVGCIFGGW